jgi:hypothetical protein
LAPELRALLVAHKGALLDHLREAKTANGDGVAAWIECRRLMGLEGANPATVARLHAASVALNKRSTALRGDAADPDRHCWPNDPSPDAAMNTAETALFARRHARLLALGFTDGEADRMADLLKERDREGDDRRSCAECRQGRARRCADGAPLPAVMLHRCHHFDAFL